ncbi:MAG: cob(I)yrinic acid a,c-diamide adenosyltransferase, partial [Nocardioidaceae bacterium]
MSETSSDATDRNRDPHTPPRERPARKPARRVGSLVMVNTGHGKGKSTAAFGVVLRSVARGWQVSVLQFVKSGKWRVGE